MTMAPLADIARSFPSLAILQVPDRPSPIQGIPALRALHAMGRADLAVVPANWGGRPAMAGAMMGDPGGGERVR